MENLLINQRDREFTLYEMLDLEKIFQSESYGRFSREEFSMALDTALTLAWRELYPVLLTADKEGCRLQGGSISVPAAFHPVKKLFDENGWTSLALPRQDGGQGFSVAMYLACCEPIAHNAAFYSYLNRPLSAGDLISRYGSDEQKERYLGPLAAGKWGGPITLTEADAGCDINGIRTRAARMPDGSYRLSGTKVIITNGDSDLFENMVYAVLARIENAPAGAGGLSWFIVPKFLVNEDGSLNRRNDYTVGELGDKMGLQGYATCTTYFGGNGECYAELLGKENMGMALLVPSMAIAQLVIGMRSTGMASAAYLHAVKYAKERIQGVRMSDAPDPQAPKVPIIEHPDVRRMLMWMKAHVEGMRALVYFCGVTADQAATTRNEEERSRLQGLLILLTPICRVYCSDMGFRVCETAVQVHGGYGYFKDFPAQQFLRDIKLESLYESTNGIQALVLTATLLGTKCQSLFLLLEEINKTVDDALNHEELVDLAEDLKKRNELLAEVATFFSTCAEQAIPVLPIVHAYPFLTLLGVITLGWLLLWQAGLARASLNQLLNAHNVDKAQAEEYVNGYPDAAFYDTKLKTARYYIKNALPAADGIAAAIKNADLSMLKMSNESF